MTRHLGKKMKNKSKISYKKIVLRILIGILGLVLIVLISLSSYLIVYKDRVYPNLSIAGVSVAGKTQSEAAILLSKSVILPKEINLIYQDQVFKISASDISLYYDYLKSVSNVYYFTRTDNIVNDLITRTKLLFDQKKIGLAINLDNNQLSKIISIIAGQISIDPIEPSVSKSGTGVFVSKGSPGREVDQKKLIDQITYNISQNITEQIIIPVDNIDHSLDNIQAQHFASRAEKFIDKKLILKFEDNYLSYTDTDILKLLEPNGGYKNIEIQTIIQETADRIERDPQNPKFVFENGKVTEFQPALDGIKVDSQTLKNQIAEKLDELYLSSEKSIELTIPVAKTLPEITIEKVNNLGIKELIGRGTSTYFHSIPGRVHNVSLAATRINGTLVKPGETFSFNQVLGDVSAFTGYQQAYIISGGKTILGDGGGVCQVSTTLFRAVLDAGLPVNERQSHAYRVSYYEQGSPPGFDATVYSPSPDLKFTNDTPAYILIEATADTKNYSLSFDLYGTSDGRISSLSKPVVTNVSAPPEDLYQDDPTLPTGTIKQIDWKAWGAKVTFNYSVKRDGQEIYNKTFISNYKPWQAVYLRGTGPVQ